MVTFVGLYRGKSLASADLIAVSTDWFLAARVAKALLASGSLRDTGDAIQDALRQGRREALQEIVRFMEPDED